MFRFIQLGKNNKRINKINTKGFICNIINCDNKRL